MEAQLVIDNQNRAAKSGATFERRHPVSNAVVTRAAAGGVEDAIAAVDSASAAFKTWRHSAPSERRRILLKAADALEARTPAFIEAMAAEVGASGLWAGFNVYLAANLFREAASLATQIQGETIPTDKPGALSMTVRQPVGVILSIVPWNGPVVLAARAIAYPIVCGNTVVFRASEASPRTHMLVAEALVEAGLPPGVLNLMTNAPKDAPEVIDALIAHKAVRRINFTGSTRVGRIIAQKAATHLKRCLLELGGKSPTGGARRRQRRRGRQGRRVRLVPVPGPDLHVDRAHRGRRVDRRRVRRQVRGARQGTARGRPGEERRLRDRPDGRRKSRARA